jgi:hypothetical protein
VTLLLVAAFICALLKTGLNCGWIDREPSFFWPTLILLTLTTAIIFKYLYNLKNPSQFVMFYLLLMVVKIIAYLGYSLVIVLKDRAGATENIVFFMAVYLVFTALEVGFLFGHLQTRNDT